MKTIKAKDLKNPDSIGATEARSNFQELIDHVHYTKESIMITKHDKPWAVIVPLPEDEKKVENFLKEKKIK